MAPTETLAEQHFQTIQALMAESGVGRSADRIHAGLTASGPARKALERRAVNWSWGTRADRGQRALRASGRCGGRRDTASAFASAPRWMPRARRRPSDILHMTATRSRGRWRCSLRRLDHAAARAPRGRRPVQSSCAPRAGAGTRVRAIREELRAGRQAFVVCPLVEESECCRRAPRPRSSSACEAASFATSACADARTAAAGRQARGDGPVRVGGADVLVATSVIESASTLRTRP